MTEHFFQNPEFQDIYQKLLRLDSSDAIYQEIISFGKSSHFKKIWDFHKDDKVEGCQSLLYVKLDVVDGKVFFDFYSDAIISQGLAALLVTFYNGMTVKEFLTTPPAFLKTLNFGHLLSLGRSNGLNSLYKKMIALVLASCKEL